MSQTDERAVRPYRMTRRAELQQDTRRRITESAVALHESLGPAYTSMSAVAEHAGVRRLTLYRHFPDEAALFDACSTHWSAANPPPDLGAWAAVADPGERLRKALVELHAYYARTGGMLESLYRDEPVVPLIAERFAVFHEYLRAARQTLLAGRPRRRGAAAARERAAVGHAVAFSTWRSLVREQELADDEAVGLLCALVAAA